MTLPEKVTVRLYKFDSSTGRYTLEEEYETMEDACKGNNCIEGVVEKFSEKDDLALT